MENTGLYFAMGLVLLAGLLVWWSKRQPTIELPAWGGELLELGEIELPTTLPEAAAMILDAAEVADHYVKAAEQLRKTGKLPEDMRFPWVLERMQRLFPDLTEEELAEAIETKVMELNIALGLLKGLADGE